MAKRGRKISKKSHLKKAGRKGRGRKRSHKTMVKA